MLIGIHVEEIMYTIFDWAAALYTNFASHSLAVLLENVRHDWN